MSEHARGNDYYLTSEKVCSSGRASRRSIYATHTTRHWENEKYRRKTLHGPARCDGRVRTLKKRIYKSKWQKIKDRRMQNARDYRKGLVTPATKMMKENNINPTRKAGLIHHK